MNSLETMLLNRPRACHELSPGKRALHSAKDAHSLAKWVALILSIIPVVFCIISCKDAGHRGTDYYFENGVRASAYDDEKTIFALHVGTAERPYLGKLVLAFPDHSIFKYENREHTGHPQMDGSVLKLSDDSAITLNPSGLVASFYREPATKGLLFSINGLDYYDFPFSVSVAKALFGSNIQTEPFVHR